MQQQPKCQNVLAVSRPRYGRNEETPWALESYRAEVQFLMSCISNEDWVVNCQIIFEAVPWATL